MEQNSISSDSSCKDVAEFFFQNFSISEEVKNKLIEESISGDILIDIPPKDYKLFGIKPNSMTRINHFINNNIDKLKGEELKE